MARFRQARPDIAVSRYCWDLWSFGREGSIQMTKLAIAVLLMALLSNAAYAQTNAGEQKSDPVLPFTSTQVASFDLPWRIAFLPDGRMLVTEKVGRNN